MPEPRVTIKIPRPIYERIQGIVEDSSFSSCTDFIVYVLRDLVSERGLPPGASDGEPLSRDEIEAVRRRLKTLGDL